MFIYKNKIAYVIFEYISNFLILYFICYSPTITVELAATGCTYKSNSLSA